MIRIAIVLLILFNCWVLLFSQFSRQRKLLLSGLSIIIVLFVVWFENIGETPKTDLISADQITVCDLSATQTYRSNFDVSVCLNNASKQYATQRLALKFDVQQCQSGKCESIDNVGKTVTWAIAATSKQTRVFNLSFDNVAKLNPENKAQLRWAATVETVWATKR